MKRNDFTELIELAELVLNTIDTWGGINGVRNRIDIIDEFLKKMDSRKEILLQLDRIGNNLYEFKSLLTVEEAAAYLGVHRTTVYKLIKSHGLTACNPPSTKMLILTEELVEWCKLYPNGGSGPDSQNDNQKKKGTKK